MVRRGLATIIKLALEEVVLHLAELGPGLRVLLTPGLRVGLSQISVHVTFSKAATIDYKPSRVLSTHNPFTSIMRLNKFKLKFFWLI